MNNAFELEASLKVMPVQDKKIEGSKEGEEPKITDVVHVEKVESTGFEIISK